MKASERETVAKDAPRGNAAVGRDDRDEAIVAKAARSRRKVNAAVDPADVDAAQTGAIDSADIGAVDSRDVRAVDSRDVGAIDSADSGAIDSADVDSAEIDDEPTIDSADLERGQPARDLAAIVVERIAAGKPVRRTLDGGGRLHVDRALPFLCVYRPRGEHVDVVARDFVRTQAAYLVAPVGRDITPFVEAVVDELAKVCGACLLLELWVGDDPNGPFRIHAHENARLATTIDALADALREMKIDASSSEVRVEIVKGATGPSSATSPIGLSDAVDSAERSRAESGERSRAKFDERSSAESGERSGAKSDERSRAESGTRSGSFPLMQHEHASKAGVLSIGLEVPPRYRPATPPTTTSPTTTSPTTTSPTTTSPATTSPSASEARAVIYPFVAQAMARELAHALQRGFFEFARVQTPLKPAHFQSLGRRYLVRAVREADHALAEISSTFDFLLAVTPVNTEAAWQEFCESGQRKAPVLRYRMLEVDPALGKRQLYDLPLDRLEDPVLAQLLHDKRRELDRQLGLLEDRDTAAFVHGSVQLYGAVSDSMLAEAEKILARPAPAKRDEPRVGCKVVAERARAEIARYREKCPALSSRVDVRDDIAALMVSHGDVLVPAKIEVTEARLQALLQHEVGTHVVTYANGFAQPLRVLAAGLAGYEALQEGLALLAEYVAGGLDGERLRLIAARVVAVRRLVEGAEFPDVVRELVEAGFSPRGAFGTTVRVFRGGGLTKDAIYLRGLLQLLAYLRDGKSIETLLVGKIAFDQVPLVEELVRRDVLKPAVITPHWLDGEAAAARIAKLREGLTPLELLEAV